MDKWVVFTIYWVGVVAGAVVGAALSLHPETWPAAPISLAVTWLLFRFTK